MKVDTYKCDVCGLQKAENNHWFIVHANPQKTEWKLVPWGFADSDNQQHLCSDACVVKAVQQWLTVKQEGK